MSDSERNRRIVRLASEQVKDPSTRSWLLADERGTFEKLAAEYLDKTAGKASELGMSPKQVDDEIATVVISLRALTAQLEQQKKRKRR